MRIKEDASDDFFARLEKEMMLDQQIMKELISSTEYVLWLEEFTKVFPKFNTESFVYDRRNVSATDEENVRRLTWFYDAINRYAYKNSISPAYVDPNFYGDCYCIKYNGICYYIGVINGQGTLHYCERCEMFDENAIDFEDIMSDKPNYNYGPKLDELSKLLAELLSDARIPKKVIRRCIKDAFSKAADASK